MTDKRPPPRITIENGSVWLHMTTSAGEAVSVALEPETVFQFVETLQRAALELKTPEGKQLLKGALVSLWHGLTKGKGDGEK